jgi:nitroreductase
MNSTIETILTRRSIRRYKPEQFSEEILKQILNAGIFAPSAMGRQPWHLLVVRGHSKIEEINREVKAATARMTDNPYKDYVASAGYRINYHAPTFVIVSGNIRISPQNAPFDCALVLGNMFLAAHSLGIGSCWINQLNVLNDEPDFRSFMSKIGIPNENRIFGCACFGYADNVTPEPAPRKENNIIIINSNES